MLKTCIERTIRKFESELTTWAFTRTIVSGTTIKRQRPAKCKYSHIAKQTPARQLDQKNDKRKSIRRFKTIPVHWFPMPARCLYTTTVAYLPQHGDPKRAITIITRSISIILVGSSDSNRIIFGLDKYWNPVGIFFDNYIRTRFEFSRIARRTLCYVCTFFFIHTP